MVLLNVTLYTICPLQNNKNMPYHVASVDYTHVESATASFEDMVILVRTEHSNRYFGNGLAMASIGHGNS